MKYLIRYLFVSHVTTLTLPLAYVLGSFLCIQFWMLRPVVKCECKASHSGLDH
jgi:hypothetical protein